ncbi:uncharacterized protein LOC100579054 [Apis mellifera]|uniref:Uncharacterized protein LOC100579054 n=1 Tax=Apis mellifera TaxID=7460 RepID=A0A7M7MWC5_APIME|nr:uncharacterized protein LOC100579054 [Apis mellifera]|eukprot:XP_026302102.1 uncharacterized protein LOC100579054 [Apis mellifera]
MTFLIAFFIVSLLYAKNCDYICDTNDCKTSINYSNNLPAIKFCTNKDISTDVNFSTIDKISKFLGIIQIKLKPPKNICKYELILLANESINEKKCMNYNFNNSYKNEIHSRNIICFVSNNKQYQNTGILVPYVFTACYSVQFNFQDTKMIKMIKNNKFLRTNYERKDIEPILQCTYEYIELNNTNKWVYFDIYSPIPIITVQIKLGILYNDICSFNDEDVPGGYWNFHLLDNYLEDNNHNFNITWQTSLKKANYCATIYLCDDIRYKNNTLWSPLHECFWYKSCQNINTIVHNIPVNIIFITLFTIIGIMYLIYIIYIYKDIKKKIKWEDININRDIVLLYTKGPESFMALMTDFRETLSQVCQCIVHDWHNGIEWNNVAKIGAFDWFAKMLHNECHVVWIDIPILRSLITQSLNKNNSEQYNLIKIGDFRDTVLPTIFNLSKRNIEQSAINQSKHFIVRLKEFENFENDNDPFIDLSPHIRYVLPQDLNLLCSNLSKMDK